MSCHKITTEQYDKFKQDMDIIQEVSNIKAKKVLKKEFENEELKNLNEYFNLKCVSKDEKSKYDLVSVDKNKLSRFLQLIEIKKKDNMFEISELKDKLEDENEAYTEIEKELYETQEELKKKIKYYDNRIEKLRNKCKKKNNKIYLLYFTVLLTNLITYDLSTFGFEDSFTNISFIYTIAFLLSILKITFLLLDYILNPVFQILFDITNYIFINLLDPFLNNCYQTVVYIYQYNLELFYPVFTFFAPICEAIYLFFIWLVDNTTYLLYYIYHSIPPIAIF